jgi:hypothetical protein
VAEKLGGRLEGPGDVRITTYVIRGDEATDTVPLASLPLRLDGHNGYVVRRDVREDHNR